jgi:tetratricopeptide (TPR) repeat protein
MPKQIKKRATKSPVIQDIKAKRVFDRIQDFYKARRKNLITIGSLAGAVIVLYLVLAFYNNSLRQEAYSLEQKGYNYYYGININSSVTEEERWQKALELFKESVKVRSSATSLFYLGNCYYKLGDYGNAIKEYNVFTKEFKGEDEILPVVYQKLASAYIKTGQSREVLSTLGELALMSGGVFKDTALILEARYYKSIGEPARELERYRELVSLFPASSWLSEARARIDMEESGKTGEKKKEGKEEKGEGTVEPVEPAKE